MIEDERFVKEWINAYKNVTGLKALAEKLGVPYAEASARASRLRRAGVKLPTMPKKDQKHNTLEVDVDGLNSIIISELGEDALHWRNR